MVEYYKRGQYIPGLLVNGMDVLAVRQAAAYARRWTTSGKGPILLEFVTYRYGGHRYVRASVWQTGFLKSRSMSDPGTTYRSREEIQRIRSQKDAIEGLKRKIIDWGVMSEDELKALDKE